MAALKWRDLWGLYCPEQNRDELDYCAWLQSLPAEWPAEGSQPSEVCDWLAQLYSARVDAGHRKAHGQFFAPPAIARFMADLSMPFGSGARIVEPGAGVGALVAALAERVAQERK